MTYTQYKTRAGDRWDLIAFEMYGDPNLMGKIIEANPDVPIYDVFPGETILNIPVIERKDITTDKALLPPWKR